MKTIIGLIREKYNIPKNKSVKQWCKETGRDYEALKEAMRLYIQITAF